MSGKKRLWRSLACLVALSLVLLATSGFRWGLGNCQRSTVWNTYTWCDTWGCHAERREVTTWVCGGGAGGSQGGALFAAAAAQPQPVVAMQVPQHYLAVPYPWTVVITPQVGPEQTFVIPAIPIYDISILNELEAQWPSPPGSGWRVFGADPGDLAAIQAALPRSMPFEVRDEAIYSFHAAVIEPTMPIVDFDAITQEWIPSEYVHAPEVPLIFEPHHGQGVRPNSKIAFAHVLTNTAPVGRTFDLAYESALGWDYTVALAEAPPIPVVSTGPVAPGESVDIVVSTWIPWGTSGAVDTIEVTATAQDDPAVSQFVVDRVYVWYGVYLPIMPKGTG